MINGIIRQRRDAATQHVWIVKTSLQCPRENISACRAHSVTTAPSCELTANTTMNMTVPDLEKLIPTIMGSVETAENTNIGMDTNVFPDFQTCIMNSSRQRKALEVHHLDIHAWSDAKEMDMTIWPAK